MLLDIEPVYFPFYQSLNLHRNSSDIYDLVTDEKFGYIAASLLQTPSVRLYQTAIFQQDPEYYSNYGTAWHQDLNMVPLDTGHFGYITFWCPLHNLSSEKNDSILLYAEGSHRDISLIHWYPTEISEKQKIEIIHERYLIGKVNYLNVGDCTAHHGWIYHSAPPQPQSSHSQQQNSQYSPGSRIAFAMSFVSDMARVLPDLYGNETRHFRPFSFEDSLSFASWINDLTPMTNINHPLLPLVYSTNLDKSQNIDYEVVDHNDKKKHKMKSKSNKKNEKYDF